MLSETIFEGRLTKDPFCGKNQNGKNFASFSLAVPRNYKNPATNNHDTDFFSVTVWGKSAQFVQENCKKGSLVLVMGRLTTYDKQTDEGGKLKMITLNAREIYNVANKTVVPKDEVVDETASNNE